MNRWLAIFAASCAIAVFGVLFDWIHAAGLPTFRAHFTRGGRAGCFLATCEPRGSRRKSASPPDMASAQRRRLTRSATLVPLVGRVAIRFANAIRPA